LDNFPAQVRGDFAELLKDGFEVFDDFLGKNVGIGKIVVFFKLSSRSQKMSRLAFVAVGSKIVLIRFSVPRRNRSPH
jgi:hypothetical protein